MMYLMPFVAFTFSLSSANFMLGLAIRIKLIIVWIGKSAARKRECDFHFFERYADALPETSKDIALKHLIHYLEAHRLQQRLHRSHLATFLPVHKKHSDFQQLNHQEERRIVEILTGRKAAEDSLNRKLNAWLEHYYHPPNYHDSIDVEIANPNSGYFHTLDHKYPNYPEEKQSDEMNNNGRFSKDLEYEQTFDVDRGRTMEEPVEDTFHKYINHDPALGILLHHEGEREAARSVEATESPEFTFKFDNSNYEEKHPFAVAPNDLRYYEEAPFSLGKHSLIDLLSVNCPCPGEQCFSIYFSESSPAKNAKFIWGIFTYSHTYSKVELWVLWYECFIS